MLMISTFLVEDGQVGHRELNGFKFCNTFDFSCGRVPCTDDSVKVDWLFTQNVRLFELWELGCLHNGCK